MWDTVTVGTRHYTFTQTHRMYNSRNERNVNRGFWVITTCRWKFSDCITNAPQCWDIGDGEAVLVGAEGVWEICALHLNYL